MKKTTSIQTLKFIDAQTLIIAVMKSMLEKPLNEELQVRTTDAMNIAVVAIDKIITRHPKLAKYVDKSFEKITTVEGAQ